MSETWPEANQRYLTLALDNLRAQLNEVPPFKVSQDTTEEMKTPPALETLVQAFGLSTFERDLLLLAAAPELDSSFSPLFAELQTDPLKTYPTFSLALIKFKDAYWSALTPLAPLRRWHLLEVNGPSLTQGALRLDERILHYLAGVNQMDEKLSSLLEPVFTPMLLPSTQQALAEQVIQLWSEDAPLPLVQLSAELGENARNIAAFAAQSLGLHLWKLPLSALPSTAGEIETFLRLCERETILSQGTLLIEVEEKLESRIKFFESAYFPLVIVARERQHFSRPIVYIDVPALTAKEQEQIWLEALQEHPKMHPAIEHLVAQFNLQPKAIKSLAQEAHYSNDTGVLWQACRIQARANLDSLAERIESSACLHDLVLPERELQTLREIVFQVRQRYKVYEVWGFSSKGQRGLGITALFAGASGTGKTLAAEVLAGELNLDLYKIDLSQVVSKYIGETEKNLRKVFDAAEAGGAILLFDEADALFGKRSEVKDSHDRYANLEVSYLLQRMEQYRGLAILTTNLKDSLDKAFLRRLRFVVQFPFPGLAERAEIWQRVFPSETPTQGLEPAVLARLNLPGGNIRNIALYGAFLAAETGEAVRMNHLYRAAQVECGKLERPLSETEIGGWL